MTDARMTHEELETYVAADALGGLSEEDRRAMLAGLHQHGPDCAECRRMLREYAEVAAEMAMSLPPMEMSEEAEERLMAAALAERPASAAPAGAPALDELADRRGRARTAPVRARRWLAAAAVAAAIAVVAGAAGYAIRGSGPSGPRVPAAFVSFVSEPGTQVATFPAKDGERLAVAYHPGENEAWIFGSNLDPPGSGKVYELWFRPRGGTTMRPAGTFVPEDGSVVVRTAVGSSFDTLAVTRETGLRQQPTTQPIFVTTV